jgi:hypothetical protein
MCTCSHHLARHQYICVVYVAINGDRNRGERVDAAMPRVHGDMHACIQQTVVAEPQGMPGIPGIPCLTGMCAI